MPPGAPAAPDASKSSPPPDPRAFRLGVWNGALYQGGEGFIDSNTVLPVFLSQLTTSNALIGFASAMSDIGWLAPQFLVSPWVARHARQMPVYRAAAIVRGSALAVLTATILLLAGRHPTAMLVAFFLLYGVFCFGAGFGAVSFMEVVGRTVPAERLGAYFSQRLLWGGLFAAVAALLVRQVLAEPNGPGEFALLFGVCTLVASIGYAIFCAIREPEGQADHSVPGPIELLAAGMRRMRDEPPFRRLFLARSTLSLWFTVSPFIVLFAVRDLSGGARAAGTFLFARVAGFVLSNLLWQHVSRTRGDAVVMRLSALGIGVTALASAAVALASPWALGWLPSGASVVALEVLSAAGGATQAGVLVAYGSLLLRYAPERGRQNHVASMNTFLGPTMLLPMLGGAFIDLLNAPLLFAVCGALAFVGAHAARRLPETRIESSSPATLGGPA